MASTQATNGTGGSKRGVAAVERGRTKTLHFVRHAQATHNQAAEKEGRAAYERPEFMDARLTEFGREQCAGLREAAAPLCLEIELVVVSPLSRAIETATLGFPKVPSHVPWIALECVRERSGNHACDKRRTIGELKAEYPSIDWSQMTTDTDDYWDALGEGRETDAMMVARAHELFDWMRTRPESNIAVVTHSAFLSVLFNAAVRCGDDLQRWFENAELRTTLMQL